MVRVEKGETGGHLKKTASHKGSEQCIVMHGHYYMESSCVILLFLSRAAKTHKYNIIHML